MDTFAMICGWLVFCACSLAFLALAVSLAANCIGVVLAEIRDSRTEKAREQLRAMRELRP